MENYFPVLSACGFDAEFLLLFLAMKMQDHAKFLPAANVLVSMGATGCVSSGLNQGLVAYEIGVKSMHPKVKHFFGQLGLYLGRYKREITCKYCSESGKTSGEVQNTCQV